MSASQGYPPPLRLALLVQLQPTPPKQIMTARKSHTWLRHIGDSKFHVADMATKGQVRTRCNGSWPIDDEFTEQSESPQYEERCDACQRALIDVMRIERGLDELVRNSPTHEDWPSSHEFDLGGES